MKLSPSQPALQHRRKTVLFYGLTLLCALLLSLAISEALLRILGIVPTRSVHTASEESFKRVPGPFEPGQNFYEESHPRLGHHVSINALGYRGPEVTLHKKPGVTRILCIGDSFTYGQFVNEDGTFPSHVQRLVLSNEMPVEVINAGVPGTTIIDQIRYMTRSLVLQPDLVVLTFSENDIDDLRKTVPMYQMLENNRKLKSKPLFGLLYQAIRNTALFNFGLHVKNSISVFPLRSRQAPENTKPAQKSDSDDESLWREYEEHLSQLLHTLEAKHIDFVLMLFPSHYRIEGEEHLNPPVRDRLSRIEAIASNMGIRAINILPDLQNSGLAVEELYLLPYDGHPSSRGYSIQANAFFHVFTKAFKRQPEEMATTPTRHTAE